MAKYNRILIKLSGEALSGDKGSGIDEDCLHQFATQIKEVVDLEIQVGIVIGGGNIFRGLKGVDRGFDRVKGDQMGMLATVINSLALQSEFEAIGQKAKVYTSIRMEPVGEGYCKQKAMESLANKEVVIIAGGTGNPYFTTDSAAALRAIEIEADILLKGTRVDGIYSADPEKDKNAVRYHEVSFVEVYKKQLQVMDLTAFTLCKENNMPIMVFNMNNEGDLLKIVKGNEQTGSLIH